MIQTLQGRCEATLKAGDSRFIGIAVPVESEEEARRELAMVAREHPGATHICHAYRLGAGDAAVERSSDAGEPAGSAGAPMLSVIRGRNLSNVLVAVVRFFGGTKLGIGGLARAYRDTARSTLDSGRIVQSEILRSMGVVLPLALAGEARSLLARMGGEVLSERYTEAAEIHFRIPEVAEPEVRARHDALSRGAARWLPA